MEDLLDKKRARILAIQKNTLVQLVQNYFIGSIGNHYNVNVNVIDWATWKKFATILNTLGPPKTYTQWKNSFQCMCTRIRKKVTLRRGTNPADYLSKLDLQIYQMLSKVDFDTLHNPLLFHDNEIPIGNASRGVDIQNTGHTFQNDDILDSAEFQDDNALFHDNEIPLGDVSSGVDVDTQNTGQTFQNNEISDSAEFQDDNDIHWSITARNRDNPNAEGTEMTSAILDFEELENENQVPLSIGRSKVEHSRTVVIANEEEMEMYVDDAFIIEDSMDSLNDVDEIKKQTSRPKLPKNVASSSRSVKPVKTNAKIPDLQKERLVQLIQNNFPKAVGRFAGAQGVAVKAQVWKNVAKELNRLGPARTADQWKTTFNGIKASAKEKLADNHNNDNGMVGKPLNRLQKKIVAIYGLDSLDGDQRLGEAGFNYKKTVPVARRCYDPRNNSIESLEHSHNILNRFKGSQVTSTATTGAFKSLAPNTGHNQPLNKKSSSTLFQSNSADSIKTQNCEKNWSNGLENASSNESEITRPASSEEDMVLRDILREIWNETDDVQTTTLDFRHETERDAPPRSSTVNDIRNTSSTSRVTCTAQRRDRLFQDDVAPHSTNRRNAVENAFVHPTQSKRGSSTRANISAIARIPNNDDVRGCSRGRNIDDEDGHTLVMQNRDRSNLRNRYTSYDMVQRSIQQQELFIEQNGRNHAEMMYASDRNHSQMIGMFTSTLKTLADVARDIFNKQ